MHYYKRNIGDYAKKAGRLSMIEHGAYTLLLDACYDRERFPTLDEALDWLWARSDEEVAAITFVLNKFFDLEADGRYVQSRIQDELDAYQAQATTNQRIAREREAKRREAKKAKNKTVNDEHEACSIEHEACESVNEACESVNEATTKRHLTTNQEPLTKNQEPLTNLKDSAIEKELNISFDDFWSAYDKKVDRAKCEKKWLALTDEQREMTMQHIPAYLASVSDKQFVKNPITYLNNQSWNNEIISNRGLTHAKPQTPFFSAANTAQQQPSAVELEIQRLRAERGNSNASDGIRTVS